MFPCFTSLVRHLNLRETTFSLKYARFFSKGSLRVIPNILPVPHGFLQPPRVQKWQRKSVFAHPSRGAYAPTRPQMAVDRYQSVRSDTTTVTYADEDIYGREGDILRSMGYSRCLCLGLISTGIPDWLHPTQDFNATSTQGRVPFTFRNFFEKLWDGFLRR